MYSYTPWLTIVQQGQLRIDQWHRLRHLVLVFAFASSLNFLRAMKTTKVSVQVIWKFVEMEKPEDKKSNDWWRQKLGNPYKKCFTSTEAKHLDGNPMKDWDISLQVKVINACYSTSTSYSS